MIVGVVRIVVVALVIDGVVVVAIVNVGVVNVDVVVAIVGVSVVVVAVLAVTRVANQVVLFYRTNVWRIILRFSQNNFISLQGYRETFYNFKILFVI